jgi:hypothetical protein
LCMAMHIEIVQSEAVSLSSWNPRAKISENLFDQWNKQGDICSRILNKLIPLSSICKKSKNKNSSFSMSIKTSLAALTMHGALSEFAIGCL